MSTPSGPEVTDPEAAGRRQRSIRLRVNGVDYQRVVSVRTSLVDFVRAELGLTGSHVGCEHGVCGACTILVDGQPVRGCLMLAVQADGAELTTVEGLADGDRLHPIQQAFWENHGLQCGFCTPGILLTVHDLLSERRRPTDSEIRAALSGNICRCTGYQNIVRSVRAADEAWER
jgi:aerobic-type carbon monoxide dehydrogenase small subunit (CoxS/CutS family)